MVSNSPTLFPDVLETKKEDLNFHMYWRMPDQKGKGHDGWIAYVASHPNEYAKRTKAGWAPLAHLGSFTHAERSVDTRNVPFNSAREPWRVLFQNDGEAEFPITQLIAYGWDITPPYNEVTFPQLAGIDVPRFLCPECNLRPVAKAQHLMQHLVIGHSYLRRDVLDYGKEAGIDFTRVMGADEQSVSLEAAAPRLKERELTPTAAVAAPLSPPKPQLTCDVPACTYVTRLDSKNPRSSMTAHMWHHTEDEVNKVKEAASDAAPERSASHGTTAIQET